ncbi:MAG: trehalose-phosphatase [Acetobacteraceae bacterium]|nr:trehalose-phosphatase [Acetobacteraceae bacterium]
MSPLPAFDQAALLLDLDGTLLDIAPTPDSVVVPATLLDCLTTIRTHLNGALAIISGRPIEQVDLLLRAIPTAVAGEHGGALRHSHHSAIERPDLPSIPADWLATAEHLHAAHPGTILERKIRGLVLHYRLAPKAGGPIHAALTLMVATRAREFVLMEARMAWEIRPIGADKGSALRQIMAHQPFTGRRPIFIGDDVTDRDAIAVAQALGGAGLFVPDIFGSPTNVRTWLAQAARDGAWPACMQEDRA